LVSGIEGTAFFARRRYMADHGHRRARALAQAHQFRSSRLTRRRYNPAMASRDVTAPADRVFFRDVKPYEAPEDLAQLRGPSTGLLTLPGRVYWAPEPVIDLDVRDGSENRAYRAVIAEGSAKDQIELLNRGLLVELWPRLVLPRRVRELWETRFPELTAA
jgi:hypothetical protein